jgi:hypothetical protein
MVPARELDGRPLLIVSLPSCGGIIPNHMLDRSRVNIYLSIVTSSHNYRGMLQMKWRMMSRNRNISWKA